MGKKVKRTRWRTFALDGHHSDASDESNPRSGGLTSNGYYHNGHHRHDSPKFSSRFTYSSQSSPVRKYQNDSSNKTTRSNSTTSEHKTTFNEDEYTKITTPRQDVLFKKGYLNKPKTYQTQTSTGNSTTTTCTPDHQSADGNEGTDLEYESQFVYPTNAAAFVDQNGVYYINGFEALPLVVCNAPFCYPAEYPDLRTKRYSTDDSAAESISPQNEEVNFERSNKGTTNQDYDDGVVQVPVVERNGHLKQNGHLEENVSKETEGNKKDLLVESLHNGHVEEDKEQETKKEEEITINGRPEETSATTKMTRQSETSSDEMQEEPKQNGDETKNETDESETAPPTKSKSCSANADGGKKVEETQVPGQPDAQNLLLRSIENQPTTEDSRQQREKSVLKADAEEFVPRMLRDPYYEHHHAVPFHHFNFPPNMIPVPFINANDMRHTQFLPPGIPFNYLPATTAPPPAHLTPSDTLPTKASTREDVSERKSHHNPNNSRTQIDIERIVSKLEEAAIQQNGREDSDVKKIPPSTSSGQTRRYASNKSYSVQKGSYYNQHQKNSHINGGTNNARRYRKEGSYQRAQPASASQRAPPQLNNSGSFPALVETASQTSPDGKSSSNVYEDAALKRRQANATTQKKDDQQNGSSSVKSQPNGTLSPKRPNLPSSPSKNIQRRDEWISVSSKKKRKHRNATDELSAEDQNEKVDEVENDEDEDDGFERYDVSQLEDVVPPSCLPDVSEPVKKDDELVVENVEPQVVAVEQTVLQDDSKLEQKKGSQKKASKKQKHQQHKVDLPVRRVMISDSDFAIANGCVEKTDVVEDKPNEPNKTVESSPVAVETVKEIVTETETTTAITVANDSQQQREKKTKKKKKKTKSDNLVVQQQQQSSLQQSTRSSSATTINNDDAYDFLVESSLAEEFQQKTNVEVSQELDRLIHRGIYSELGEKMKSLNVDADLVDGFFRLMDREALGMAAVPAAVSSDEALSKVMRAGPPGRLLPSAATFRKDMLVDFDLTTARNRLSARNLVPASSATTRPDDPAKGEDDNHSATSPISANLTATSCHGAFRHEDDERRNDHEDDLPDHDEDDDDDNYQLNETTQVTEKLYPVTRAVKDWLIKTRENSPDIRILKSPDTIFKELGESLPPSSSDDNTPSARLRSRDEITVCSPEDQDLLDCWDDEMRNTLLATFPKEFAQESDTDNSSLNIDAGEEALEDYESAYGKNEDFLRIRAEVAQRHKDYVQQRGATPHPHRAICCTIM